MAFGLQTAALNAVTSALGLRFDVSPAWKFYVEVLGVIIAEFNECSGLSMEREVKRVREGGTNDFEWLLPGQIVYGNITLKRGITYNRELWRWFRWGILDGQVWGVHSVPGAGTVINLLKMAGVIVPQGTHMSIILGTVDGKKARHWDVIGAIPVKWTGPQMQSGSDQVAVEELEIAHQGIDLSLEMGTPMSFFSASDNRDLSSTAPTSGLPEGDTYYNAEGFLDRDYSQIAIETPEGNEFVKIEPKEEEEEQEKSAADEENPLDYFNLDRVYSGGSKEEASAEDSAFWALRGAGGEGEGGEGEGGEGEGGEGDAAGTDGAEA